jgi:hypothetical protein
MIPRNEMTPGAGDGALGPGQVLFDDDGVDLTLVRWMLSLTPADRLEVLQGFAHSLSELRHEEADS